ncbi:carbohydrate ABC transporter permease [Bifidobacterium platyrrhinorum]|uniref:ABC transporter permease subunit n=1 Tax=Bifidobacterium platyrrhinorum TaxID=2661628 RepID=A0A6L9SR19_9BIFI|nr:carbohydrate ABC transporter permease [Bifidobacterium platyrrhinorum]NEG54934.1 ABC transporter permease subunit [Bifidobacterium platyrrhinorum]
MSSASYSESGVKTNSLTVVRKKSKAGDIIHAAIVILLMLVFLAVPFWILIVTAGKTQAEAVVPSMALPTKWHLIENIQTVIVQGKVFPALIGSLLVTVPSVCICLLFGSMAAWIFGRRSSKGVAMLYALFISGVILPPSVVTIMMLLKMIGLSGTAIGMNCVYIGIYLSVVIFFITGFIRTIPPSLEEAARIDGASPMRIFFTIIFPLLAPTLASSTILVVLYIWNDIFYSLFILSGKMSTLPLNLYNVASAGLYLNNWHLIFAYIILMTLPLLIVFIIGQRKIISGITGGAVK